MRLNNIRRGAANGGRVSLALVLSYAFDWFILVAAIAAGGALAIVSPNMRPFALNNITISYPYVEHEKVPTIALILIGGAGPVVIIAIMCLFLVPGPTVPKSTPRSLIWRRKLWELHTGWLGLGLAIASAFLITQGMKNLFGKPRPDLLSRCQPDLANRAQHVIGGFSEVSEVFLVYSATICQQPDKEKLDDGFRSFPSGHSSFSASGLIYLSLFIASKLAITIPFLPATASTPEGLTAFPSRTPGNSRQTNGNNSHDSLEVAATDKKIVGARNLAAAPPVYLLVFAIIPFFGSIYISATRFSDFRHHGFDILFGYGIGVITAIFSFRYYHLPISTGAGWSWGPRSKDRSFWAGVGVGNYVGVKGGAQMGQASLGAAPRAGSSGMTEIDIERNNFYDRQTMDNDVGTTNGYNSQYYQRRKDSSG